MTSFLPRTLAVAGCAGLLIATLAAGAASAQTLPSISVTPDPNDPTQQMMLAGEANAVAQYLGISTDELTAELHGHSLAQVAQQHGKDTAGVTGVLVGTADQELDGLVSQGLVSSDDAAQYSAAISLYAPLVVNSAQASAWALQFAGD